MSKKMKIISVILGVLFIGIVIGLLLHVNQPSKDSEWGISLKLYHSSPSGATFELIRNDEGDRWELLTGESYFIERWTPFGWKNVDGRFFFTAIGYSVKNEYSKTWSVNWEAECGKLPTGIYRIAKDVGVLNYYKEEVDGSRHLELLYYAPFVVMDWVGITIVIVLLVILILVLYLHHRFRILTSLKKFVVKRKKLCIVVLIVLLFISLFVGVIYHNFCMEISGIVHGYEVELHQVDSKQLKGNVRLKGSREETKSFMIQKEHFHLEKKTFGGWKRLTTYDGQRILDKASLERGEVTSFMHYWPKGYEELSEGTYRIVQPCYTRQERKGSEKDLNVYITFTVPN